MVWPVGLLNISMAFFIALASFRLAYHRSIKSTSNCKWEIGPKVDEIPNPSKCSGDGALEMIFLRVLILTAQNTSNLLSSKTLVSVKLTMLWS